MLQLGRIVVSGPGIQIDYRPEIRPFIPNPTLIAVPIRKHAT